MRAIPLTALALLGLTAACAPKPEPVVAAPVAARPTDTGSMAFPAPNAAGTLSTTGGAGRDTGSMAFPNTGAGGVNTTTSGTADEADTGSMALPAPRSTGRLPARRVR